MKKLLFIVLCSCSLLAMGQQTTDTTSTQPVDTVLKGSSPALKVGVGLGIGRKMGTWQSTAHPEMDYLLNDLKYSANWAADVNYCVKQSKERRTYVGLVFAQSGGKKTMPNAELTDSLGILISDSMYQFSNAYTSLALQWAWEKRVVNAPEVYLVSGVQIGKTWYNQHEKGLGDTTLTASMFTVGAVLGLEVLLSKHLVLGSECRFWYANTATAQVGEGEEIQEITLAENDKIQLSRFQFLVGLKYRL